MPKKNISTFQAALPILFLLGMIIYGLVIRPYVYEDAKFAIPLEIVFLSASFFAASYLFYLGYSTKY